MLYVAIRTVLMTCLEILLVSMYVRILRMRSLRTYCVIEALSFVFGQTLRGFPALNLLRAILSPLTYLVLPVALSVGRLRTRIARASIVYLVYFVIELVGAALYTLITGDVIQPEYYGPDNFTPVVTVYLMLIVLAFVMSEATVAICAHIDRREDLASTMLLTYLLPPFLLSFSVLNWCLHIIRENVLQQAVALFYVCHFIALLVIVLLIVSMAKRDAETLREATERALALRGAKHSKEEAEAMVMRARGMTALRHALANQMRSINQLTAEGDSEEAARRLSELRAQARILGREDSSSL